MNGANDQFGVSYRAMHRMFELLNMKQTEARKASLKGDSVPRLSRGGKLVEPGTPTSTALRSAASDSADARETDADDVRLSVGPGASALDTSTSLEDPFKYEVKVSMMEIYNDQVIDLLAVNGSMKSLDIRQAADGSVCVPDLIQVTRYVWRGECVSYIVLHVTRWMCSPSRK
jgi:hypothetical protein